jgi:AcrR family transcriptional regulator
MSQAARPAGQRLSRETIIEAYLRIADAQGHDGVNMRRLGRELGVDATAVYRYFRDKDEILAMAAARLLREVVRDVPETGPWRERLRALLLSLRGVYLAHPNALLALQLTAPMLEEGYENVDLALALLRESGLPEDEIPLAFEALETYTIGGTVFDARATRESLERWRRVYSGMPESRYPNLASTGRRLYTDMEKAFSYALDLFFDAIEAKAHFHNKSRTVSTSPPRSYKKEPQANLA